MSRTKNAIRNLTFNTLNRILLILIPFAVRTVVIYVLGIQYLGITSLFSSILVFLSLAELGFGDAIIYSMYEPIANNNVDQVNALLNYYKKCYRIIGLIILIIGLAVSPFLPYLISGSHPADINLYIVYYILLFNTVIGYFLFAYKRSLLNALQRGDITSNVSTICQMLQAILQIGLLVVIRNYYFYVIVQPFITILDNVVCSLIAKRKFPQYSCAGKIDAKKRRDLDYNVKGLIAQKVGSTVLFSADTVVISAFLGLTVLGVYSNYIYVTKALSSIIGIITVALTPIIGNYVVKESVKKNYVMMKRISFIESWILTWMSATLISAFQVFIKIWAGQDALLPDKMMILIVIYFYTFVMNETCYIYRQATGIWWQGRYMTLVSAAFNVLTNIILVCIIGLPGVVISTVVAELFISLPWAIYILFKNYFKERRWGLEYLGRTLIYFVTALFVIAVIYFVTGFITFKSDLLTIIVRIAVCIVFPNIILLLVYIKTKIFKDTYQWLSGIVRGYVKK